MIFAGPGKYLVLAIFVCSSFLNRLYGLDTVPAIIAGLFVTIIITAVIILFCAALGATVSSVLMKFTMLGQMPFLFEEDDEEDEDDK